MMVAESLLYSVMSTSPSSTACFTRFSISRTSSSAASTTRASTLKPNVLFSYLFVRNYIYKILDWNNTQSANGLTTSLIYAVGLLVVATPAILFMHYGLSLIRDRCI